MVPCCRLRTASASINGPNRIGAVLVMGRIDRESQWGIAKVKATWDETSRGAGRMAEGGQSEGESKAGRILQSSTTGYTVIVG